MKRVLSCLLAAIMLVSAICCAPAAYAAADADFAERLYGGDISQVSDSDLAQFLASAEGNRVTSRMRSESLYVDHLDVEMTITSDRVVSVVETLDVVFNEEMHGYQRYIPSFGSEEMYRIINVKAEGDVAHVEEYADQVYIRLGSEFRTVEGHKRYVISYDLEYYSDITAGGDRIYQNVFPAELENYVRNATARIRMPEGTELLDQRLYFGAAGRRDNEQLESIVSDGVMYIYSNYYLEPYEGATVELLFPDNTFAAREADICVNDANIDLRIEKDGRYIYEQSMSVTVNENANVPVLPVWQAVRMNDSGYGENNPGVDNVSVIVRANDQAIIVEKGAAECYPINLSRYKGQTITVTSTQTGYYLVSEGDFALDTTLHPMTFGYYSPVEYKKITANVHLPEIEGGLDMVDYSAVTDYESSEYYIESRQTQDGFTSELKGTLPVGDGFSISIGLPEGVLVRPANWLDWTAPLLAVALLAVALVPRLTKKEKELIPTMEFYPPDALSPAQVGYIIDSKADSKDLTSLIYYWASQGHMSIEMTGKNSYTLHKLSDLDDAHQDYEHIMFRKLWVKGDGQSVKSSQLSESYYATVSRAMGMLKKEFNSGTKRLIKAGSERISSASVTVAIILTVLVPIVAMHMVRASKGVEVSAVFMAGIPFILALILGKCKWKGVENRSGFQRVLFNIGIFALAAFGALVFAVALGGVAMYTLSAGILAIALAVAFSVAPGTRCRTDYGTDIIGRCLGFKNFLETAEKERLEMLLEENPDYYYDILPYAQVMGVSDIWSDKFADLTTEPPEWFYGASVSNTTARYLMNRSMTRMNTNMTSVPQVSSTRGGGFGGFSGGGGGFGGGFSGGGGGGGGGGGW